MQVEQKRACASCGSGNAPDASFCWRCLAPFAPLPPPPGATTGLSGSHVPPAPASWSPPSQQTTKPARSSRVAGVLVSILAAAVGYLGVQYLMGPSLSLPDSLASAERLTDPESQRF